MDTNALNEIQNTARVLAVFAPESGRKLRRALDNLAECRNDAKHEQHAANCYRANCDEARDELHKLALLVYANLPEVTPEYCRINPTWRMDDATTPWPAIIDELKRIEDAAIRKLLATPEANGGAKPSGMTWQEAQEQLERIRQNGEPYTSERKMANRIGCHTTGIRNAIKNGTIKLQEWASKKRGAASRKVVATIEGQILDGTPQSREADPDDILENDDVDRAMRLLMEQAEPNERARINAMSPADRRALAELAYNDPDAEERIMSSKRKR